MGLLKHSRGRKRMCNCSKRSYDESVDMLDVYYDKEVNGRTVKYIMSLWDNIYRDDEKERAIKDLQTALDSFKSADQYSIITRLQEVGKNNIVKNLKYGW
jgi:hypothetical protein